jgi:hypothetical protein
MYGIPAAGLSIRRWRGYGGRPDDEPRMAQCRSDLLGLMGDTMMPYGDMAFNFAQLIAHLARMRNEGR